jgi:hypothetical protein
MQGGRMVENHSRWASSEKKQIIVLSLMTHAHT